MADIKMVSQNFISAQLGTLLAEYVSNSSDQLAVAFRTRYAQLHPSNFVVPVGDYNAVVHYMDRRDSYVNYLARAKGNKTRLALTLTRELSWSVNPNSLSKALKRVGK